MKRSLTVKEEKGTQKLILEGQKLGQELIQIKELN